MRIGVFYDRRLPYEGVRPHQSVLENMMEYAELIDSSNYQEKLKEKYDCLIHLQGAYFLKPAWKYLKAHVMEGRGLITVGGGTPFSRPLSNKDNQWTEERIQTAYHEELHIRTGMKISRERIDYLAINPDLPVLQGYEGCFTPMDTLGFIVQFTHSMDIVTEEGSSGPMDAVMFPLLTGFLANGRKTAAPVVMIENTKGMYEGGRWIFINQETNDCFWNNGGCRLLSKLSEYAGLKAYELLMRPNYASYYPGEQPTLLMQGQSFGESQRKAVVSIRITQEEKTVMEKNMDFSLTPEIVYQSFPLDVHVEKGIYLMKCTVAVDGEPLRIYRNGFWGYDQELLESGEELTCGRDYFYKDGKSMPVVGMTYMQSDVHRKYIYLPNVYRWNTDFADLKQAGVNMVRTGIWTGFRTVMFNDGIPSEEILRALDGMFLTAKKYDIPIVFNFFAFAPEMWEGCNPYLDPRSVKAQKRFISSIVSRHSKSKGVSWDLINEPSVSNPKHLWRPAPNRDPYELAAWRKWLKERHGSIEELQERWNCSETELPSFDRVSLPEERDFSTRKNSPEPMKGLKALDYILFTQFVLNQWAAEMKKAIRAVGSRQLVTIGQDEALGAKRPSPFFYQETMDYTTNHSWWLLDDLYWDGIFAKTPLKPNLIQETGIMYTQNANGKARRNEAELRNILERKYALAFASNNAGAVHWIWNINIYMKSLNEVNIGAVRADNTQKLEADVSYDFGDFIKSTAFLFERRKEEDAAVIYPYSNDFSVRDYAPVSTKRLARVLGYQLNIPFKAYGEYHLEELKTEKLIIIPSPRTFSQKAWDTVMDKVEKGSILLFTGPYSDDEYWERVGSRADQLKLITSIKNVSREETLYVEGEPHRAAFGYDKIAWIDKETEDAVGQVHLRSIPYGKGKIVWCPLPIEMNEEEGVIEMVYLYALKEAKVTSPFQWIQGKDPGILIKKLDFDQGNVYIAVSECGRDMNIRIKDTESGKTYGFMVPADRAMLFAVDNQGNLVKTYRDQPVEVV